jgi:hypothetical protein
MRLDWRALPIWDQVLCRFALPRMQGQHLADWRDYHARIPYPSFNMVLGRLPRYDANTGTIRTSISKTTRAFPIRNSLSDPS